MHILYLQKRIANEYITVSAQTATLRRSDWAHEWNTSGQNKYAQSTHSRSHKTEKQKPEDRCIRWEKDETRRPHTLFAFTKW